MTCARYTPECVTALSGTGQKKRKMREEEEEEGIGAGLYACVVYALKHTSSKPKPVHRYS